MILVDQLEKHYSGSRGLNGFTLRVEKGDLFGLVGPNGAGKTTLIKILSTLIHPDSGRAHIHGIDVTSNPQDVKRVVGYMPDQPGFYQDMRVQEFLEFFAEAFLISGPERRAAVEKGLIDSGLAERRDSFVEELSFGMKQRLFLAKTLLHSPKVLLLDEPATGLDPLARVDLRNRLRDLNEKGITILISSHILADLQEICTRVSFIADGLNQADEEGRTTIELRKEDASHSYSYDVGVLRESDLAAKRAMEFPGVRVLDVQPARMMVEISGDELQAAEFLRHLITGGIQVVRFDHPSGSLEERYRDVFGGKPR